MVRNFRILDFQPNAEFCLHPLQCHTSRSGGGSVKLETEFIDFTPAVDETAKSLFDTNPSAAVAFLTDYSNGVGAVFSRHGKRFTQTCS